MVFDSVLVACRPVEIIRLSEFIPMKRYLKLNGLLLMRMMLYSGVHSL